MKFLVSLKRPEYIFRPAQIIRRLMCEVRSPKSKYENVPLPWGVSIRVQPSETVGSVIRRLGIYELSTSECISRLVDPGDLAVDIGANIGHMTSIMAMRAGPNGKVIAFEPHPVLFRELERNIADWQLNARAATIIAHNVALSNIPGTGHLVVPSYFDGNHGVSFLASETPTSQHAGSYEVPLRVLDAEVKEGGPISLLKIDVEGHELKVLQGAQRSISSGNIRNIIFEDFATPPTPVTELLEVSGYTIYRIACGFMGPILHSIKTPNDPKIHGAPNFLATRDPGTVTARMEQQGWMVYSRKWHHRGISPLA